MLCEPLSLGAAFLVGLAGSGHCLAMCGGLTSAFALRAGAARGVHPAALALLLNLGRLGSYTLAGALAGLIATSGGGLIGGWLDLRSIALGARLASGLVLLAIAVTLLTRWRPLGRVERLGGRLWRHLAPLARHLPAEGPGRALLLGGLWGFMPCGFVYTLLLFAALRGSALAAALTLAAFGLGTLPALLGSSLLAARVPFLARRLGSPRLAGWALLGCGVWTLAAAVMLAGHHH